MVSSAVIIIVLAGWRVLAWAAFLPNLEDSEADRLVLEAEARFARLEREASSDNGWDLLAPALRGGPFVKSPHSLFVLRDRRYEVEHLAREAEPRVCSVGPPKFVMTSACTVTGPSTEAAVEP